MTGQPINNVIGAYINDDADHGDLFVLGDEYIYQEWIIRGRTSKFDYSASDRLGTIRDLFTAGLIYRVHRENDGRPYIEESGVGSTKYYVRQPSDEASTATEGLKLTFKVNPTNISLQKRKLFTKLRTKGGFEFQHWGPDIGEISVEGTTGNIIPQGLVFRSTKGLQGLTVNLNQEKPTVENSPLLAAFRKLETTYDEDQSESKITQRKRLALEYRGRVFVGHFSEFSYNERGDRPFQLYYKFTFLVHYEATSLQQTEVTAQTNIVRNKETLNLLEQIRRDANTSLDRAS